MKQFLLFLVMIRSGLSISALAITNAPVQLFVPDGQLRSHPIRVFLGRDITTSMKPSLMLIESHALLNHGRDEIITNGCFFLARNQTFSQEIGGTRVSKIGTLLLVDLSQRVRIPWYKAVERVTPSLAWTEPGEDGKEQELHIAGGDQEIYVGNIIGAFVWTSTGMVAIVGFILVVCRKSKGSIFPLLCGPDGTFSLWRIQMLAWTLAVGSVVVCFGLTRLNIPAIPEQLVALMGMSFATGGLAYNSNRKHLLREDSATPEKAPRDQEKAFLGRLGELLCDETGQVSVSKAQMVFWTLSILLLFSVKSFQQSSVWEVPWTMVALMGVSHAGYLGPKLFRSRQTPPHKPAN